MTLLCPRCIKTADPEKAGQCLGCGFKRPLTGWSKVESVRVDGKYQLRRKIWDNLGAVFEAEDPAGGKVAVKVLGADLRKAEKFEAQFRREAGLGTTLGESKCFVTVKTTGLLYGDDGPVANYMVLEWVPWPTLRASLHAEGGSVAEADAIAVGIWLLDGLASMHTMNVLHHDLKPENLFVRWEGHHPKIGDDGEGLKVADLGLASVHGAKRSSLRGLNADGSAGTDGYMAPERLLLPGERTEDVDHRADLWAVGAILWEMVTGEVPYTAGLVAVVSMRKVPPRPPTMSAEFYAIVAKALAYSPGDRYGSAAEFRDALIALRAKQETEQKRRQEAERKLREAVEAAARVSAEATAATAALREAASQAQKAAEMCREAGHVYQRGQALAAELTNALSALEALPVEQRAAAAARHEAQRKEATGLYSEATKLGLERALGLVLQAVFLSPFRQRLAVAFTILMRIRPTNSTASRQSQEPPRVAGEPSDFYDRDAKLMALVALLSAVPFVLLRAFEAGSMSRGRAILLGGIDSLFLACAAWNAFALLRGALAHLVRRYGRRQLLLRLWPSWLLVAAMVFSWRTNNWLLGCDPGNAAECRMWCDQGSATSCFNLAKLSSDSAETYRLWQRGCRIGLQEACTNELHYLASGLGVEKDTERALRGLSRYCAEEDSGYACWREADIRRETNRGSTAQIQALLRKACSNDEPRACPEIVQPTR